MNQCDSIIAALFIQVKVIICQNRRDHSYLVRDEAFRVIEFVVLVAFHCFARHDIAIDIASSAGGSAFENTRLKPCDGYCDFRQDNAAAIHKVTAPSRTVYKRGFRVSIGLGGISPGMRHDFCSGERHGYLP